VGRRTAVDVASLLVQDLPTHDVHAAVVAAETAAEGEQHDALVLVLGGRDDQQRAFGLGLDDPRGSIVHGLGRAAVTVGGGLLLGEPGLVALGGRLEGAVASTRTAKRGERVARPVPGRGPERVGLL